MSWKAASESLRWTTKVVTSLMTSTKVICGIFPVVSPTPCKAWVRMAPSFCSSLTMAASLRSPHLFSQTGSVCRYAISILQFTSKWLATAFC